MAEQSYNILIVGAGPVGLTAAAFFAKAGHRVRVLERSHAVQTQGGGGLSIQPAATRCLQGLGEEVMKWIEAISIDSSSFTWWSYKENKPMSVTPYPEVSKTPRYQMERGRLNTVLLKTASRYGAEILYGKKVVRVEDDYQSVKVWTEGKTGYGKEYEADLVVGADGITSAVRKAVFPRDEPTDPITTTERIFLTSVPHSVLSSDPRVQKLIDPYTVQLTLGPGRFVLTAGLTDDRLAATFVLAKYGGDDGKPPAEADGTWEQKGDMAELRELFKDFNEPTRAYLEHVESCTSYSTATSRKLKTWQSPSGHTILIGDAAHAIEPYAAQGLSQGIEDAAALARAVTLASDIGTALSTFEELRRPRVERITAVADQNGAKAFNTLPDGEDQEGRDGAIKMMHNVRARINWPRIKPFMAAAPRSPGYEKWEQDLDVVAEVEKKLEEAEDDYDPGYQY